ncbi:ABC transporter permease [candidate division KSB1 bacterium]
MEFHTLITQAFDNLRANKLRSTLTLFGITWGIVAIMVLVGFGLGFRTMIINGMAQLGKDLIFISPGQTSIHVPGTQPGRQIMPEISDLHYILSKSPLVREILPIVSRDYDVKVGNAIRGYEIRGVYPSAQRINNWHVADGRFLIDSDMTERRRFAFIGHDVKNMLFGENGSAVGETIHINKVRFTVIGVATSKKPQMSTINSPDDEQILLPFTTVQSLWGDNRTFNMGFALPADPGRSDEALVQIRTAFAERHNFHPDDENALFMMDFNFFEDIAMYLIIGLNVFLIIVGFTTLFIGGIGVMNIMLLSVQERTREIGIRKAVGASQSAIKRQFLFEAVTITTIGGLFGYCIGAAIIYGVNAIPFPPEVPIPQNSPLLTAISICCIMFIGIIAGYLPAKKAAEMEPIQALHYEQGEIVVGQKIPKPLWTARTLIGEMIGEAIMEMRLGKGKTLLTTFGIVWGLTAVITLIGFGLGFRIYFDKQMSKMGEKMIRVYPGRAEREYGGFREGRQIRFTLQSIEALTLYPVEVEEALPEINCGFPVIKYRNDNYPVHTLGVVPRTRNMRNFTIASGRFINERDIREHAKVCFIAAGVKENLFDQFNQDPVGEYIRIGGIRFRVVGLAEKKGFQNSINNSLDDDKILIPYTTAKKLFSSDNYIPYLLISPVDRNRFQQCKDEINLKLGAAHHFSPDDEEALREYSELEGLEIIGYISLGLSIFLGGIGAVTLFVGGIGVLNIMLFTVSQRTREIGIRRAMGALRRHIFIQFLIEAMIITVIGGLTGYGIGTGIIKIVNVIPVPDMVPLPQVTTELSLLATFFLVCVGLLSGIAPALRAMRLNVVESLRYE